MASGYGQNWAIESESIGELYAEGSTVLDEAVFEMLWTAGRSIFLVEKIVDRSRHLQSRCEVTRVKRGVKQACVTSAASKHGEAVARIKEFEAGEDFVGPNRHADVRLDHILRRIHETSAVCITHRILPGVTRA